ncbi:MAG: hypothetical protein JJT89_12130 [Nitriliruptoraceae bacterium]|nr:hypothetical protein [Nitriliruptoraceae bacterium]
MNLDDTTIRDLIGFTDEHGVLSFYAGNTPAQAAERQPTAPIEIRNQLKALRARLNGSDDGMVRAVEKRLDALDGALEELTDARSPGRGRALFVGVDSGEQQFVNLQIPFRERVVHRDAAYVRPLVAALDEGREAGILVVSHAGARLLTWSLGTARDERRWEFEIPEQVLSDEKAGPSGNSESGMRGRQHREHLDDRIDEHRRRFLRDVIEDVGTELEGQGRDRLVVAATPKIRDEVVPMAESLKVRVLIADRAFEDAAPHEIADGVWDLLRSVHLDRERALATSVTERALGGGAGALGLRHVCDALNEGRVSHLLYDDRLELEGFVSAEGTLHPRVEGVMAASDVALEREPFLVERMIEAAIRSNALVTPLQEEPAAELEEHEGVGALLRW